MAASTSLRPPTLPLPRASGSLHPTKLPFSFNPNTKLTASKHPASPLPLKVLCSRNSKEVRFRPGKPDPVYKNRLVTMLVNRVMKGGKKSLAYHIIYLALKRIRAKTASSATNPLLVLRDAIREVTPDVTVKARRVGGSTHQVPVEVGSGQGKAIAIRWLLEASRKRQGKSMVLKLSDEVMDAARGTGEAVRMKEAAHKMAEANRAFAHFPAAVTKDSWEKSILKSDVPVLVEFYASWCGPCQMVHRVIDEIAGEYVGKLKCLVLNTDTDLPVAEDYEVKAVPVVLLFKNGEKKESIVGTMPKEFYIAAIERVLKL